jgi:hypothetical protein
MVFGPQRTARNRARKTNNNKSLPAVTTDIRPAASGLAFLKGCIRSSAMSAQSLKIYIALLARQKRTKVKRTCQTTRPKADGAKRTPTRTRKFLL